MDQGDQLRLAGHGFGQDRIACPHAVRLMRVASSCRDLAVFPRQLFGAGVGSCRLAAVKCSTKSNRFRDLRREIEPSRVGKSSYTSPRTDAPARALRRFLCTRSMRSARGIPLISWSLILTPSRHDDKDMSRIPCIILDSLEHHNSPYVSCL